MNFLFLMNPLDTVVIEKDTTFMFMLEAHKRGYGVYYLPLGGIIQKKGCLFFHVTKVIPQMDKTKPFVIEEELTLGEDEVNAIFIRTDPPFDADYLMHTWILSLVEDRIAIINKPTGVRNVNEKVWAMQFSHLTPRTLLTRHQSDMQNFLEENVKIVAKPTDGFGGQSVFILDKNEGNASSIFESLSNNWTREIILQKFVKESEIGDKRILLLNGEPLGAVLRVHSKDSHVNNFFAGGKPEKTILTANDQKIIDILKPRLRELGLYFVGIDIMGDYLIEVNVTSPTCLQEINRLNDVCLQEKVIDFTENLIDQIKTEARI